MNREEVIATAKRITDIRAELARLGALQKELKTLEAQLDALTGTSPPVETDGTSISDRVAEFIDSHAGVDWEAQNIATELGLKKPSVVSALSKLVSIGRIGKSGRGKFRSTGSDAAVGSTEKEKIEDEDLKTAA